MGRPSVLACTVTADGGRAVSATVARPACPDRERPHPRPGVSATAADAWALHRPGRAATSG